MNAASASPPKPRLLVIDDEPLVGSMLTRLLRRRYAVTSTTSGHEGLRLAIAEHWDAILCDIMMPELSGPQFLQRLAAQRAELTDHVGFMTGGAFDPETRAFLDRCGEKNWLPKPFGYEDVQAFVQRLCEPRDG